MKYIASCSFGKDSLAAILTRLEHNEPVDEALYCRIMFDDETSAELPEHEAWIHDYAIPLLESRYGIKTTVVQANTTYLREFMQVYKSGRSVGQIKGFPHTQVRWCNSLLKVEPLAQYAKLQGEHRIIVGIAVDETKRIPRAQKKGQILPLVDNNITEADAFEICRKAELRSPAYDFFSDRLGCWFCFMQKRKELYNLYRFHGELYHRLLDLEDIESCRKFRHKETLHELQTEFDWKISHGF